MRQLEFLEHVIERCDQKLPKEAGDYSHYVMAIKTLFGLFLKAHQSDNPKVFLLRHLENACSSTDIFNPNLSQPLTFEVNSAVTFYFGAIYFEFLTLFDESVCHDAKMYIDILSAAPIWKARLLNAPKKMLEQFREYYQNTTAEQRLELENLEILDSVNMQIKNAISLYRLTPEELERDAPFVDVNRGFYFRVMADLPTQAFEYPTLVCLKKLNSASYFYYPAGVLENYPISINDLSHIDNDNDSVININIYRYQLHPLKSLENFVLEGELNLPAVIEYRNDYWVYGNTPDGIQLNSINADIGQREDAELCDWLYNNALHIPLIHDQDDYPIFNKIHQILQLRAILNSADYSRIHLIEQDNPQIEAGHLYVKKNTYDRRLTVSLKACSGQLIENFETEIELDRDELSEADSNALREALKRERLIPYLEPTQQNLIDHLNHLNHRHQAYISNDFVAEKKQIHHDYLKSYLAYTSQSVIHGLGVSMLNQRIHAGFNIIQLINIIQNLRSGYDLSDEDIVFGEAFVHKQKWGYWLKVCVGMMLFSCAMGYAGWNATFDNLFAYINGLNIISQVAQVILEHDSISSVSLDDQLSLGFALLSTQNFEANSLKILMLIQLGIIYLRDQNLDQEKNKILIHQDQLMQKQANLQKHLEYYNTRVQQAAYCLQQMRDLLDGDLQELNLNEPLMNQFIDEFYELMNQYSEFMIWRDVYYLQCLDQFTDPDRPQDFMQMLEDEIQRFNAEVQDMDFQFQQIKNDFLLKGQEIRDQLSGAHLCVEQQEWSWTWLYQPTTEISAGLLLISTSIVALQLLEVGVFLSLGLLASQLLTMALVASTVVGVSATIYGLLKQFENEDLSDFHFSQAGIAPSPNNS